MPCLKSNNKLILNMRFNKKVNKIVEDELLTIIATHEYHIDTVRILQIASHNKLIKKNCYSSGNAVENTEAVIRLLNNLFEDGYALYKIRTTLAGFSMPHYIDVFLSPRGFIRHKHNIDPWYKKFIYFVKKYPIRSALIGLISLTASISTSIANFFKIYQ